ncbi:hypothetical protein COCVIDRAFT_19456 [Bipolaris victoriae FI3]|uniref:Heterokaryon incompatibility domain-containing protein n=1 Tax=Bipolaris victoriae (strain FI3) TaxID=930091 RepID=W7E747_BIPV3|nr:hypothetical protein COCVIDRAFT_19456 [Bipolaris victoriae FI3]
MDLFPEPDCNTEPLLVPLLVSSDTCPTPGPLEHAEFVVASRRYGIDFTRLEEIPEDTSPTHLASIIQSWLYFGTIEAFAHSHVDLTACVMQEGESPFAFPGVGSFISSKEICRLLNKGAKETNQRFKNTNGPPGAVRRSYAMDGHISFVWHILDGLDSLPLARTHPLPVIQLSIRILVIIIIGLQWDLLQFDGHDRKMYHPFELKPVLHPAKQLPSSAAQVLLEHFEKHEWCPYRRRQMCENHNYAMAYYMTRLANRSPPHVTHAACSDETCVANDIDPNKYTSRHTKEGCSCPHVRVPSGKIEKIINEGGIPLVKIKDHDSFGLPEIEIVKLTEHTPYVAISHVWSHGLGNPHDNSLPCCQLRRVATHIAELRVDTYKSVRAASTANSSQAYHHGVAWDLSRFRLSRKNELFWLDTLCVPVGRDAETRRLKTMSINKMAAIYAIANHVMVLDDMLSRIDASRAKASEVLARINISDWMGRCWTLQEGALNLTCQVKLLNSTGTNPRMIGCDLDFLFGLQMFPDWFPVNWISYGTSRVKARDVWPDFDLRVTSLFSRLLRRSQIGFDHMLFLTESQEYLFGELWKELSVRTTTKRKDTHIILASLLRFSVQKLCQLSNPADRLSAILWSLGGIPFSFFCSAAGPRDRPEQHHENRWLPLYPNATPVRNYWLRFDTDEMNTLRVHGRRKALLCDPRELAQWPSRSIAVGVCGEDGFTYIYRIEFYREDDDTFYQDHNGPICIMQEDDSAGDNGAGACFLTSAMSIPEYESRSSSDTRVDSDSEAGADRSDGLLATFDCPVFISVLRRAPSNPADATESVINTKNEAEAFAATDSTIEAISGEWIDARRIRILCILRRTHYNFTSSGDNDPNHGLSWKYCIGNDRILDLVILGSSDTSAHHSICCFDAKAPRIVQAGHWVCRFTFICGYRDVYR